MCLWEYFTAFLPWCILFVGRKKNQGEMWLLLMLAETDFRRFVSEAASAAFFFIWIDSIGLKMCRSGHSATGRRKSGDRVSQRLAETRLRQRLKEGKFFLDSKKPFFCKKLLTIRAASSSMRSIFWLFYKRRRAKLKWRKPRPSLSYAVVLALFCKTEMFCESGLLC